MSAQPSDLDLVVSIRETAADGVVVLGLREASGASLPSWEPGAHVDLMLADGLVRQYSLCGDPADLSTWRVGVLREPVSRGGSQYVHDKLFPGTTLTAHGPRNHFAVTAADRFVFIAGGIGITPLLPMIASASAGGVPWHLTYGGRRRASMAFLDELAGYPTENLTLHPQDELGLINLTEALGEWTPGTQIYCCGPEPLITAVEDACAEWPSGSLHVERFAPRAVAAPVLSDSFEVVLEQSGITLTVPPDKSVLEVVLGSGVDVEFCCEEGTCGSCETSVLEGCVDHRDSVLDPEEQAAQNTMMLCVSRSACPRLVLDL